MKRTHIPRTWTDDQALQVASFLQELIDDIWQVYGYDLARVLYDAPPPEDDELSHADTAVPY